jgi:hypothetical protein
LRRNASENQPDVFAQSAVRKARNVDGGAAVTFGTRILGLAAIVANLTCCSGIQFIPGDQEDMSKECEPMRRRLATEKTLAPAQIAEIRQNMEKEGCASRP